MADIKIEWFIAAAMSLGLLSILLTGRINLHMGPPSWHEVNRLEQPSRFWTFVAGTAIAIIVLIAAAILG